MIHLGKLRLNAIQKLETIYERNIIPHRTLSGKNEILQDLGRKRARININGSFSGKKSEEDINKLYNMLQDGKPIAFHANTVSVTQVVIKKMKISQDQGYKDLYRYMLELEEWQTFKKEAKPSSSKTNVVINQANEKQVEQNIDRDAEKSFDSFYA